MSPGRWLLAAVLLGGAVGAVAALTGEAPRERLVGWPAEAQAVPAAAKVPATVDPGECQRARASAKAAWAVMAGATERWAAEVRAHPEAADDPARADAVAAAARALAEGRGDSRAFAQALAATSVPTDRYADALALSARADAACTISQ